jgi:PAS domain S-box-containing protein
MKDQKKTKKGSNSSAYTPDNCNPGDHTRKKSKGNKFSELRKRAEEALENTRPHVEVNDPSALSLQEIREMIHDLNVYQVELETQNDELIKLYYDLEAERNKYYDLYDLAPVGYFTIDREGRVTEINLTGASLLGIERSVVKGKPFHHFIAFASQDIYYLKRRQVLKTKVQQSFELKIKKADNTEFHAQLQCRPVFDLEGKITHIRGVIIDINRLMLAEEQLKNSLREKEFLLKELHHRVKNNLALVSSLLNLQEETVRDPIVDRVFESSRNRIKSMALVHEILYHSEDMGKIDFSQYIQKLLNYLSYSYVTLKTGPTLKVRVGDIKMPINKAIPCGLVINELVTNAFKYAFTGNRPGEIRIELDSKDDKSCQLLIGDNGIGLPADLDMGSTKSFGFTLLTILINQLKGSFEIDRSEGTTFRITFPLS